jgi:uncharacterized membrane-anchored protein YhcB (DUF1043 family)
MDMKTFSDQLEAQIKEWQRQAVDFQSQLPTVNEDLKQHYEKQIATVNEYVAKSQEMLRKLQPANEAAWKDMADGAKRSFEEWQKAVQSAMSRYKT